MFKAKATLLPKGSNKQNCAFLHDIEYMHAFQARQILQADGLLVIITPDSSHVGRNARMVRDWKMVIENLGFRRWRYEKLRHLHCMAFRKIEQLLERPTDAELTIPQVHSTYIGQMRMP